MNIYNKNEIINSYIDWIRDNIIIEDIGNSNKDCLKITTPFFDNHNDFIEIYAILKDGINDIKLTDGGYFINDLEMSGISFKNSPKREKILQQILNGFGVSIDSNKEIYIETNKIDLGKKKHFLTQALMSLSDMFMLSNENVISIFKDLVEIFFKKKNIPYNKDIKILGKSGLDHHIDFTMPSLGNIEEKIIKTINKIDTNNVKSTIFTFEDIRESRKNAKRIVIVNDENSNDFVEYKNAFMNYGINVLSWSNKERIIKEFDYGMKNYLKD